MNKNLIFVLVLFLVCTLSYFSMLNNEFMIDSHAFRVGESIEARFDKISDFFTPQDEKHYYPLYYLINVSLSRLFPENPFAQNTINVILFFGNCVLLFFIALALTRNRSIAALSAIIFCLHPFNADSVNHTDISNTLVSGLLMQGVFLCLLKGVSNFGLCLTTIGLYTLSLLCGEPAVLFPWYVFLLVYVAQKKDVLNSIKICIPFCILAAAYVGLLMVRIVPSMLIEKGWVKLELSVIEYVAQISQLIFWYLRNYLYPSGIFLIYNAPALAKEFIWINIAVFSGLIAAATFFIYKKGKSVDTFSLLWFLSGFLFVLPASMAHTYMGMVIEPHWFFFPSMGAALFMAIVLIGLKTRLSKVTYYLLIAAVIALFAVRSQEKHFIASKESLYAHHWLKHAPGNLQARLIMSSFYENEDIRVPQEYIGEMLETVDIFIVTQTFTRARKLIANLQQSFPDDAKLHHFLRSKLSEIDSLLNAAQN